MNILHISSGYASQELYSQMIAHLRRLNLKQCMYVPVRSKELMGANQIYNDDNLESKYSFILKKYHRILFHQKINAVFKDIKDMTYLKKTHLVHAHFLFSDGAAALKLKQNYGLPYIVTVRSTDVNIFFKYMIHLRGLGKKILDEARTIILITPKYRELIVAHFSHGRKRDSIEKKIKIIPNGLNEYWIQNREKKEKKIDDKLRLLFVGKFIRRKNVRTIIDVVKKIKHQNKHLTLVGGGGNKFREINRLVAENKQYITYLGKIEEKKKLLAIYRRNNIFIMPSIQETFGMTYFEAMSQGLPCIYSKGQGIDGYFSQGEIGFSVNPLDVYDIIEKIGRIQRKYQQLSAKCIEEVQRFRWDAICRELVRVYDAAVA